MLPARVLLPTILRSTIRLQSRSWQFPYNANAIASSSSAPSFSSFSPLGWWQNRQENKEAEKYKQRVLQMSQQETWTLHDLHAEVQEAANSWLAKMSQTKEAEMAQQMNQTLIGLMQVVGKDADLERLEGISRADKLKAAVAAKVTVEDIATVIEQFSSMTLMHKVLRHRYLEGKPIPTSAEAMQTVLQAEGPNFLTKQQKSKLQRKQVQRMKKAIRGR
jgi:hypothetical protein